MRCLIIEIVNSTPFAHDIRCRSATRYNQATMARALAHGDPNQTVTVTAGADALIVWIRVHNEGPPIPQELQSALFNPFRMGERSSRSPAGLGLGLYISNEVILRHGGQIEVRSTAVDGTTFRVVLPREAIGSSGDRGGDP